jgi:acyl-coenzyme A thioesterase PaaI-like protein
MAEPHMYHGLLHGDFDLTDAQRRRRELMHRISRETSALVERVVLLAADASEAAGLEAVLGALETTSARVDALPSYRERGGLNRAPGWEAALTERSPISGRRNPIAAPLVILRNGERTLAHAVYERRHEGPYDHVHGGIVMGAFDELLGVAQDASGQAGYTGTLTVRMRRPTPLFARIDYEAGVDRIEGRKVFMWGRSYASGELLCEAEGIFIAPRGAAYVMGRAPESK